MDGGGRGHDIEKRERERDLSRWIIMELAGSTVLDIVREASRLLRANLAILSFTTLILIFPVAAITLSQPGLQLAPPASSYLLHTPLQRLLYRHVSGAVLAEALRYPVVVTLGLLAKAAVFYVLRAAGPAADLAGFLGAGPSLWGRLAATHVWLSLLLLGFAGLTLLLTLPAVALARALGLPPAAAETPLLIALSVAFAHLVVASSLAHVAAALDDACVGVAAIRKALFLLRPRLQLQAPALLLSLLSAICAAAVESAFQHRILSPPEVAGGEPALPALWEAPFLISLYSFVYLFDTLFSFVFYHVCQSAADYWDSNNNHILDDDDHALSHVSIAVDQSMIDECSKINNALQYPR